MKLNVLILLTFSLLILGCGINGGSVGPEEDTSRIGTGELTIISTTFPSVAFQGRRLQGEISLHNKAGYDAENVEISLVGLNQAYIELDQPKQTLNFLEGRSRFQREGGFNILNFDGNVKESLYNKDSESLNYIILVEYSSKVEFSPTVCVDSGLFSVGSGCKIGTVDQKSITRSTKETFSGQGAPVSFNSLEIVPFTGANSEIELRMKIGKRGRGNIKSLRLGVASLGNIPLQCEFRGKNAEQPNYVEFKKSSQEVDLICTGRLESSVAYESPLYVEVFYDYELKSRKSLEIRR
jgi:hypothetical protein